MPSLNRKDPETASTGSRVADAQKAMDVHLTMSTSNRDRKEEVRKEKGKANKENCQDPGHHLDPTNPPNPRQAGHRVPQAPRNPVQAAKVRERATLSRHEADLNHLRVKGGEKEPLLGLPKSPANIICKASATKRIALTITPRHVASGKRAHVKVAQHANSCMAILQREEEAGEQEAQ